MRSDAVADDTTIPIQVLHPRKLPAWSLPARRTAVGIADDYKPSMAMLPDGELVMVGLYGETHEDGTCREWTPLWRSADGGKTWIDLRDFGDYGMMYIRVIRLSDGRLLMTYTQRSLFYPLGLRAALRDDEGETWDLQHDIVIIEGKTPWGAPSGGGFGNTLQLSDGSLISCYTYRGADGQTHMETVKWCLPVSGGGDGSS